MKVVFLGPSLAGRDVNFAGLQVRSPAAQGDVFAAVADGAAAIGLIDGYFDRVASVWHKEILYALSCGVPVLGAASMGALRAAECAIFGMQPVGGIAHEYASGLRWDDGDVALTSLPAELGHLPLTEPLINVEATKNYLLEQDLIDEPTRCALMAEARATHFTLRSRDVLFSEKPALRALYDSHHVDRKAADALQLLDELRGVEAGPPPDWAFNPSPAWRAWIDLPAAGPHGDLTPAVPP